MVNEVERKNGERLIGRLGLVSVLWARSLICGLNGPVGKLESNLYRRLLLVYNYL